MKRYICAIVLLLMITTHGVAAEHPKLNASVTWHYFYVNASLSHFTNKSLSMDYNWTPRHSTRLQVFSRQIPFSRGDQVVFEDYSRRFYVHVGLSYVRFFDLSKNVQAYFGGGPAIQLSEKRDDKDRKKLLDQYNSGPALSWVCGLDYFITQNIAVRAEYSTYVQFGMDVYGSFQKWEDRKYQTYYYKNHTRFVDSFAQVGFSFYL
jgi:hypothetical protein